MDSSNLVYSIKNSILQDPFRLSVALAALIFLCFHLVFYMGFMIDDAFISFRYAINLVDYGVLHFNPMLDEAPVEGYTNFLWVLILAFGYLCGIAPEWFARFLGIPLILGTIALLFAIARFYRSDSKNREGFIAVFLTISTGFFVYWFVAGLETGLFTFLMVLAFWVFLQERDQKRWFGLSLVLFLLTLCRPEGIYIGLSLLGSYWVFGKIIRKESRFNSIDWINLCTFSALILLYILFKWLYFSDILPNTYYAKYVGTQTDVRRGILYTRDFFVNFPFFILACIAMIWFDRQEPIKRLIRETLVVLGSMFVFVVLVGSLSGFQYEWLFDERFGSMEQAKIINTMHFTKSEMDVWFQNTVERLQTGYSILFGFMLLSFLALFIYRLMVKKAPLPILILYSVVIGYTFVITYMGGDNMNGFRFFIPLIPFYALIIGYTWVPYLIHGKNTAYSNGAPSAESSKMGAKNKGAKIKGSDDKGIKRKSGDKKQIVYHKTKHTGKWVLIALLFIGIALFHGYQTLFNWQNIPMVYNHRIVENGRVVGSYLRQHMPQDTYIATNAAGALPYYSRLATLDLLGLNDEHIAKTIQEINYHYVGGMGHEKANAEYVLSKNPVPDILFFGNSCGDNEPFYPSDKQIFKHPLFQELYDSTPVTVSEFSNDDTISTMNDYTKWGSFYDYENTVYKINYEIDQLKRVSSSDQEAIQKKYMQLESLRTKGIPWRGAYMRLTIEPSFLSPISTIHFEPINAIFYKRKGFDFHE